MQVLKYCSAEGTVSDSRKARGPPYLVSFLFVVAIAFYFSKEGVIPLKFVTGDCKKINT